MVEFFFKNFARKRGYFKRNDRRYSAIVSSEYVLENKVEKSKVLNLIKKLRPYDVGIDLIRLGPKGDGGYLVPNDLEGIEACFSPGVANVSQFEYDCSERGMKLFLADKSVTKPNISLTDSEYHFLRKFIGCNNDSDFITMDHWVDSSDVGDSSDLLLQMDIEGAEYIALMNISEELLSRFRVVVLELHSLDKLWQKEFNFFFEAAISKLVQTHTCVHIHPNNCCGEVTIDGLKIPRLAEFTFIRKDRFKNKTVRKEFPHELDYPNTSHEDMSLSEIWYNDDFV